MKPFDVDNPYFRTKVLTASPAELRMMLLEGSVRFMREGRTGLVERDYERVYEGFTQARAIVMELMNGLRDEIDPLLCERLRGLYTYIYKLLVDASFEKSIPRADEAIELMDYEIETWALVLERIRAEGIDGTTAGGAAGGGSGSVVPAPGGTNGQDPGGVRSMLSVEG